MGVDGISQATPLDGFKTGLRSGHSVEQVLQQPLFGGALAGIGWQWSTSASWPAACLCWRAA